MELTSLYWTRHFITNRLVGALEHALASRRMEATGPPRRHRLTASEAASLRAAHDGGTPIKRLVVKFGVSRHTVRRVVRELPDK